MNVLGIKIVGHDTGAAIIKDGARFAISEERLNKIKHSKNMFPHLAIDYVLQAAKVSPDEVDLIVIDQIYDKKTYDMKKMFEDNKKHQFSNAKIKIINHHLVDDPAVFTPRCVKIKHCHTTGHGTGFEIYGLAALGKPGNIEASGKLSALNIATMVVRLHSAGDPELVTNL